MRFESGQEFGNWLSRNADGAVGAWLQFAKKGTNFTNLPRLKR